MARRWSVAGESVRGLNEEAAYVSLCLNLTHSNPLNQNKNINFTITCRSCYYTPL